ncbi:MAG: hypothetical protein SGCHY_001067 [Lobulomycetales sp.]
MFLTPGERIGASSSSELSSGTYERNGSIRATVVGYKRTKGTSVCVERKRVAKSQIPKVGDVVLGTVVRVNERFATLMILVVGTISVKDSFQGIIRVQDIRAGEREKVQMYKCFLPGDVVRAKVISLGDSRSFYLSTAENELGVILAKSLGGNTMVPLDWERMVDPRTEQIEFRKCAKPVTK